jgi:hypothetical protein
MYVMNGSAGHHSTTVRTVVVSGTGQRAATIIGGIACGLVPTSCTWVQPGVCLHIHQCKANIQELYAPVHCWAGGTFACRHPV